MTRVATRSPSPGKSRALMLASIVSTAVVALHGAAPASSIVSTASSSTHQGAQQARAPWKKDITPPSTPSGLRVVSSSGTSIGLAWKGSQDNVKVSGYSVYLGTSLAGSTRNNRLHRREAHLRHGVPRLGCRVRLEREQVEPGRHCGEYGALPTE